MNIETRNLLGIIRSQKPRAALFTTYTLSLSFFEAVMLPVLRQVGCRDVSILVDAAEGAASVCEAQARYAGRRYWVAPVTAPGGGIFHPKLAYLSGVDDEDVLVVGSGNLTLPGQSSQLETVDAVASAAHPEVFRDLAKFWRSLAEAVASTSPRAAALMRDCALRASAVAKPAEPAGSDVGDVVAFVHTLGQTASASIAQLWQETGDSATKLTVLSPFHSPDGGPVWRLAKLVGVDSLDIGIDPKSLIAPFDQSRLESRKTAAFVVPVQNASARPLHGKVFEIVGAATTLVVTGSINATQQSLESTKNVEASLARRLPVPCFEWREQQPSTFKPNRFTPVERDAHHAFVDAVLEDDGFVRGQLSGVHLFPESARAYLRRGDEVVFEQTSPIVFAPEGSFEFGPVPELTTSAAIQLSLRSSSVNAECWLNVTDDLADTDEERRERQAVKHILRGEFNADDVAQLLQLLYRVAHVGLNEGTAIKPKTPGGSSRKGGEEVEDQPFTYQQWQGSGGKSRSSGGQWFRNVDALRAFIRWLNSDVPVSPAPSTNETMAKPKLPGFRALDPGGTSPQEGAANLIQSRLAELIAAIPTALSQRPGTDYGPMLATVAAAHALKLALSSGRPAGEALSPVLRWLSDYSQFTYGVHGREVLNRCAAGLALVAGAMFTRSGEAIPTSALKEAIEAFRRGSGDDGDLADLGARGLADEVFARVDDELRIAAIGAAGAIAAAETLDERIVRLVEGSALSNVRVTDTDEAIFRGVFAALRRQRGNKPRRPSDGVITNPRQLGGCPHTNCYRALPEAAVRALRDRHAIVCPTSFCGRAIFYLEDAVVARRVKESLVNV